MISLWLLQLFVSFIHCSTISQKFLTEPAREWTSCFPDLGCLNTTDEWYHPVYRPHNPLPSKRHTVKTSFIMFRRNLKKDGEEFSSNPASIEAVGFNNTLGTTVLIHDFTSNGRTGWIKRMTEAILSQSERNIIAVDWETGALPPYMQAVSNSRIVALEVELLLRWLVHNFTLEVNSVHIIGHGLGAHVAGYVGDAVHGLGRITGLDPSGPLFEKMPTRVRLDPSDASFVDVIHTDMTTQQEPGKADGQGISELSGHVDFFPNGGRHQPGCLKEGDVNLMKITRDSLPPGAVLKGCSHKRSFKYYIESISGRGCEFLAFLCSDYDAFQSGKCLSCGPRGTKCSVMGKDAIKYISLSTGKYFVQTTSITPFCSFIYRVEVNLAKPSKAKSHVSGIMVLSIMGNHGIPITMPVESKMVMKHGESQNLIAYHGLPYVNPVVKAQLSWRYKTSVSAPGTICLMCDDSLYVNQLQISSLPQTPVQNETNVALCSCDGAQYAKIKSNFSHVFVPCLQQVTSRLQKI